MKKKQNSAQYADPQTATKYDLSGTNIWEVGIYRNWLTLV